MAGGEEWGGAVVVFGYISQTWFTDYSCVLTNRKQKMEEVLKKALAEQAEKGLPFVYRDSSCKAENQFIHRYPNGTRVLIEQDSKDSSEKVLKVF